MRASTYRSKPPVSGTYVPLCHLTTNAGLASLSRLASFIPGQTAVDRLPQQVGQRQLDIRGKITAKRLTMCPTSEESFIRWLRRAGRASARQQAGLGWPNLQRATAVLAQVRGAAAAYRPLTC